MMFLFAELTKEIVFVCTIFISFTLKITCEICFWYCQGNQKTEDIFINGKLTPPHHYKFFFPCIVIFIHIYFCKRKHFSYHIAVSTPVIGRYEMIFSFNNWNLLFIIFQVESGFYPKMLLELIYNLISLSPCNKLVAPLK